MAIYRGLNTSLNLADIDDKEASLTSLGLDIRDLDVIKGLADYGLTSQELRTISGLDVDQKKELYALSRTSATIGGLLRDMKDIAVPLDFSMDINSQLRAGAIKYEYVDWSNPVVNNAIGTKQADISTSRVSSWSSTDSPATLTSDIFYGGEVRVDGTVVEATDLEVLTAPVQKRYPAEVPTHTITINYDGTPKQVHAMKGIPLTYEGFFTNANLRGRVNQIGSIPPTWTVLNQDDNRFYETYNTSNNTSSIGANSYYYFRDSRAHPRTVEFYYNPNNITELEMPYLNMNSLPNVSLPALTNYWLHFNDFYEVPRFDQIAPNLRYINLTGNNLSRTGVTANIQLDRFSTTLEEMHINGCFADSDEIDLRKYTSLRVLGFHSYYSRYGARRMTGGITTPHVANSITTYTVSHQPYARLSSTVCDGTNVSYVYVTANDITASRTPAGVDDEVYFNSTVLGQYWSYSNNHNIVKLNAGKTGVGPRNSVTHYYHTYSNPRNGYPNDRTVNGKFTGCTKLGYINLYGNSCEGDIGTAFKEIPSLDYLELRWSAMSGSFNQDSFAGSESLRWLLLAGSWYNNAEFFGGNSATLERGSVFNNCTNLQYFYCYSNGNIRGLLPEFSKNKLLRVLYFTSLGLSGTIPNFASNDVLYYIRLSNCRFTGGVPAFNGNQYYYIFLEGNQLEGQIPLQQGANIRYFYVHYNKDLNGDVPTFEFCPRLQYAYFYNNNLSGWSRGTMHRNTWLRRLDISNNRLSVGAVRNIINDMLENYQNNPRGGVVVNMLGQTDFSGNVVTEAQVIEDETTSENLKFLRTVGWTILIS